MEKFEKERVAKADLMGGQKLLIWGGLSADEFSGFGGLERFHKRSETA